jgi:carbon storage regulator
MLVLSRKPGESLMVGDDLEVVILEIRGNRIKIGFKGPPHIQVLRGEVYRRREDWMIALEHAECA